MNRNPLFFATTVAILTTTPAISFADPGSIIEEIVIIGSQEDARQIAGSGNIVGAAQMDIEIATDMNQLLRTVPGIYVREEDGYGLRPNFGIRGATSERSEKVTLLEDGVMIAPAPYSNPAAYYFPTTMRMTGVEILKGAPLLRYGPQTVGGVVNMISTPIPQETSGKITLIAGENNTTDVLANYGGRQGDFSYLLETVQRNTDGFKDIDRSNRDTGFQIRDYMLKLGWEGDNSSLLFKAQHSEESSNETYLGLTDIDFDNDEDRRYGLSEIDEMNNDHDGYSLAYMYNFNDSVSATTTVYYNEFSRDWFKLNGGGKIIDAANVGGLYNGVDAQSILDGADFDGLEYKHNNRDYTSKGVQIEFDFYLFDNHDIYAGVRAHEDKMDRFQPVETFNQVDGELEYVSTTGTNGSEVKGSNNRKETGDATSLWLVDNWQASEQLNVNLALRYEDVETTRKEYDTTDRANTPKKRHNNTEEWLPGASFAYDLNDSWQVLAGAHRGFSPLGGGAEEGDNPETSDNYEAGFRYNNGTWFVEAISFYSDFKNKAESCSNGNPCSNGATSGSYVTGDAIISGVEFQLSTTFDVDGLTIPLDIAYTYSDAEASEDKPIEEIEHGDKLAGIPENTYSIRTGVETMMGWDNYLVVKYIDETCVKIGCNRNDSLNSGAYSETESLFTMDFISHYALDDNSEVFLKVENFTDERAIVSRSPDGARPNKGRVASIGYTYNF